MSESKKKGIVIDKMIFIDWDKVITLKDMKNILRYAVNEKGECFYHGVNVQKLKPYLDESSIEKIKEWEN